eukprot:350164_1
MIQLSIDVIGKRSRNQMVNEFWILQMLTSTAISAIKYTKALTKHAANVDFQNYIDKNGYIFKYDKFLASFREIEGTEHVWAFWLYNNDTNGMVGAFRDNDDIIISQYNGTCRIQWFYDVLTEQRDLQRLYDIKCGYQPRLREWYSFASTLGVGNAKFTQPYKFATNDYAGITLVSSFMENGTWLILLSEITIETLIMKANSANKITVFDNLPIGAISMVVSNSLDVILSSQLEQVDIISVDDINCVIVDCQSSNELIVSSMNYARQHSE